MTKQEALKLAIETMMIRRDQFKCLWKDWQKYGETLAFRKAETREAARLYDRLGEAIAILQAQKEAS